MTIATSKAAECRVCALDIPWISSSLKINISLYIKIPPDCPKKMSQLWMIAKMFWLFMTHRNKVSKLLFSSIEAPKQIISLIHLKHLMKILTKMSKRDEVWCLTAATVDPEGSQMTCGAWTMHLVTQRSPSNITNIFISTIKYKHYHHHHPIRTLSSSTSNTNIIIITIKYYKHHHHQRYHQIQMTFPPPHIGTFNLPSAHYIPFDWPSCTSLTSIHLTSFLSICLYSVGFFTVPPLKMTTVWTHNLFTVNLFLNKIGSWQLNKAQCKMLRRSRCNWGPIFKLFPKC